MTTSTIKMRGRGHCRHDWMAYLALADQQEEAGDHQRAVKTRRAGWTLKAIVELVDQACSLPVRVRRRETIRASLPEVDGFAVWVTARAATLEIAVKVFCEPLACRVGEPSLPNYPRAWLRLTRSCCPRPHYVPERVVKVILPILDCPLET